MKMKSLAIVTMGLFSLSIYGAIDHNSTRSNRANVVGDNTGSGDIISEIATAIDHNSTRSNRANIVGDNSGSGDVISEIATAIDHNSTRSNRANIVSDRGIEKEAIKRGIEIKKTVHTQLENNIGDFAISMSDKLPAELIENVCKGKEVVTHFFTDNESLINNLKTTPNGDTIINILTSKKPNALASNLYYEDSCHIYSKIGSGFKVGRELKGSVNKINVPDGKTVIHRDLKKR